MSNNDKEFIFVPFGIFGSLAVGIGLFIAGAVRSTFLLSIVGVIVIVGGIAITIAFTVVKTIKKSGGLTAYHADENPTYDDDDDGYPPDDELIESVTARGPHKHVEELLKREDALLDLLYKHDMDELKSEYYDESELLWNNYKGSAWDENLDKIDALIDEYYKLFNAEKAQKSKIVDEEDRKNADFDEISKQAPIDDSPASEEAQNKIHAEKIDENAQIAEMQKNDKDDNDSLDGAVKKEDDTDVKTKSAAVGYRPMKKK